MKFKINNEEWFIKEVSQEVLCSLYGEEWVNNGNYYLGVKEPTTKTIYLYNELDYFQKKKTLCHELMHCYIFTYISFNDIEFSIDDFCDISANSHYIIHKIVEEYFKEGD